ncbi:ABC transporter permease [Cumulibacter soli]|uniref:ABC transporter permease n=1 Tax=Cumulibacter soli TaxID=2546344 RepID=UPI001068AAD9|nr:ABC transporter [Cumulibacter soli]
MTTAIADEAPSRTTEPNGRSGARSYAATGVLTLIHLRTSWRRLIAWTVALAGVVVITASSIAALYPDAQARLSYQQSVGSSPAVAMFNGRGYDLDTLGGISAYEVGAMGQLLFPLVFAHLAIRMTRREEDSGRMELIRSGVVGRLAPLAAAVQVLALVTVGALVLITFGLIAVGLPASGSLLYAVSLVMYGFAFGALALLIAEISNDGRTALGLSMLLVLVGFLVRAVIDGRGWDLVWLSPVGWLAEVRPWGATRAWPYVAFAIAAVLCIVAAVMISIRRDVGAGLIGGSNGPATGRAGLGTPVGFAWRFTRSSFYSWLAGLIVFGVVIGSLSNEMTELIEQNPTMREVLGLDHPEQLMTVMAVLLSALGAASLGVQGIARLAREEDAGRLALVLSRTVGRTGVWIAWVGVVMAQAIAALFASTIAVALATWAATAERATLGPSLEAGAAMLPAVLFIIGVASAVHAIVPRLMALAWVLVGWAAVVGLLGGALDLPSSVSNLSPVFAVGNVPLEPANTLALVVLGAGAALFVALGSVRFARRDLLAG